MDQACRSRSSGGHRMNDDVEDRLIPYHTRRTMYVIQSTCGSSSESVHIKEIDY